MRILEIGDKILTESDCFFIAEIGSNHMGDPDICEKMIRAVARTGADAVKLQKRDNRAMFTKTYLARPYENELSYGKTYGEHREHLDWFGEAEYIRFKKVATDEGLLFFATPFEETSAEFLHGIGVPMWKIASCDASNIHLIKKIACYGEPMIISTGGISGDMLKNVMDEITNYNDNIALLHCVSVYPNSDENVNIGAIKTLWNDFPENLIGFSTHHPGILPMCLARAMGASIFEAHFTLNRGWKGTDHGFSLEEKGLRQAVEDVKRVRTMLGHGLKIPLKEEINGFVSKMGKGIYLNHGMQRGEIVTHADICLKAPAGKLGPMAYDSVVGRMLTNDCATGEPIDLNMLE